MPRKLTSLVQSAAPFIKITNPLVDIVAECENTIKTLANKFVKICSWNPLRIICVRTLCGHAERLWECKFDVAILYVPPTGVLSGGSINCMSVQLTASQFDAYGYHSLVTYQKLQTTNKESQTKYLNVPGGLFVLEKKPHPRHVFYIHSLIISSFLRSQTN